MTMPHVILGKTIRRWCCYWQLGSALIIAGLLLVTLAWQLSVQAAPSSYQQPVSLAETVKVPDNGRLITLSVSETPVAEILRNLATVGDLNLLVDDAIVGTISLELDGVTINDALASIVSLARLEVVPQGGNVYLIIPRERAEEVGLNRKFTHIIPVEFANANQVAALLNQSLFAVDNARLAQGNGNGGGAAFSPQALSGQNGGQGNVIFQKVRGDARTNSLIIVGSQRDIDLAEAAVKAIDKPRDTKTFYLNYANALDVATQLMSSVFNDGTMGLMVGGGQGGAGGAGGGLGGGGGAGGGFGGGAGGAGGLGGQQGNLQVQQMPSTLRVESETIAEGDGVNSLIGGDGNTAATFSQEVTLRGVVKNSEAVMVSPMGTIVIPDTRLNAVTVMGTAQQIELAERILPALDAEPPQVSIEVSLVEISEEGQKQLGTNFGIADGKLQLGFNGDGSVGLGTQTADGAAQTGIQYTTSPRRGNFEFLGQVNALIRSNRAKVLANPTIVANHDTEAIVSIVDEIVRRVNVTLNSLAGTTTIETEIGEAGIVLDILPKIGEDGTVSMRIRPSVTSVRDIIQDVNGNSTTLLTKRDLLAQMVRVKDGETLVLGGLVRESSSLQRDKLPILGDLPIVGALFRASADNTNRSELVIMMTPHIMNPVIPSDVFARKPLVGTGM
jgi:type II secretory pathway component GspD/PulD (secretin)